MEPIADPGDEHGSATARQYRLFAEVEAGSSPCYREWASGIADDPEVIALIDRLPAPKRQVNLVFASARFLGAAAVPYGAFRRWLLSRWPEVERVALTHATQTNEPGRCAVLLPVLARVAAESPGRPLAIIEVGASAGLCLLPDRYSYRYGGAMIDPVEGPSPVLLDCAVSGPVPVPDRVPAVAWRAGIDLNPLRVTDPDHVAWLDALIWPEHDERRSRLREAVRIAQAEPPRIIAGDLLQALPDLVGQSPDEATLVVFHTAVLAYLPASARDRFVSLIGGMPARWISNEGVRVTPGVAERLPNDDRPRRSDFIVALDGEPVAYAQPHGRSLHWL